ncbi:MAG: tetratricopeptide repeat protein [Planctomycetota bacterium]|nr:tetratricopeptide repeat protein [Planctomycetota bacterium]
MIVRKRHLFQTVFLLAGLSVCPGCQYLSGPLARLQNKTAKPASGIARGNVGPLQNNSFPSAKPTERQKADVRIAFARTVEREGDHQGAMKLYQQIIHSAPEHPDSYHRLAVLHDQNGNHVEALSYYQQALERDPQNAEIHADRGYSFYLQNKWPAAEKNLRRALQLDNSLARAHNNLGLLLARTGRQDHALMEFQLAGCSEPECRANLVHAMMLDKRYSEAQQQCEIVLASHSVPTDVEKRLKRLNTRIVKEQQETQAPPPQSHFLPPGGQQASQHGLPAAGQQVSFESVQDLRPLPPVASTVTQPVQHSAAGMFRAQPMPPY